MGNVAVIASGFLIAKFGLAPIGELPPRGHFDVTSVGVEDGLVGPPRLPRSLLFKPRKPIAGLDLTVFLGEGQPAIGTYSYAHELLDRAAELGVKRVVTFASMASQIHPGAEARTHGVATSPRMIEELRRVNLPILKQGQISGLNGVLLGAAAERNMDGLGLLGEIPYFAAAVPNPKAARGVLAAFCQLTGLTIDMTEMETHIQTVDRILLEMHDRVQREAGEESEEAKSSEAEPEVTGTSEPDAPSTEKLDRRTQNRIEQLFEAAKKDRAKAAVLKRELDRMGIFSQFEDRFLDLFRRAD